MQCECYFGVVFVRTCGFILSGLEDLGDLMMSAVGKTWDPLCNFLASLEAEVLTSINSTYTYVDSWMNLIIGSRILGCICIVKKLCIVYLDGECLMQWNICSFSFGVVAQCVYQNLQQ